ncbi:hypothetical protein ACFS7Z_18975 [Pontibacter toksunensis]|uniref:Uncharacterized protein n=1 Tax=Pontibacter toksunensis TaxID=1332631 RepID=A0ABW6C2F3_9BACT
MKKFLFIIRLSRNQLWLCLGAMLVLNLLVLAGTWVARTLQVTDHGLRSGLRLLDLANENTIATWYSSMLLLSVALMSAICFRADWQRFQHWREKYLSYGWLLFCMIFVTLSLDEVGSFHETIGNTAAFKVFDSNSGWMLFYVVILLVGGFMFTFSFVRLIRSKWSVAFAVAGLLLFLSNPLQEHYEIAAYMAAPDPTLWVRPISLLLLEEGSEIFASSCFLVSTVAYTQFITKQQTSDKLGASLPQISLNFSFSRRTVFVTLLLVITVLAAVFAAVEIGITDTEGRDAGIPQNWFPSVIAFLVFVSSLYIYFIADQTNNHNRYFYLLLALVSVSISMYYGSNLYAHYIWKTAAGILPAKALKVFFLLAATILSLRLILVVNDKWSRLRTAAWAIFFFASFSLHPLYAAKLAFAAFACLLLALTAHVYFWQAAPPQELVKS